MQTLTKSISVISDFLRMFKEEMPDHWDIGDGTGGYLCTNNGIRAQFHVLKDIADYVSKTQRKELYLCDSDQTFQLLKPYLDTLVKFFKSASAQEVKKLPDYRVFFGERPPSSLPNGPANKANF